MMSPDSEPVPGDEGETADPTWTDDALSDEALDRPAARAARASYPCGLCFTNLAA